GKFCGPGAKAALVVTADPVYKERNYHVPRSVQQLEYLGCQVDIFDFDTMPAESLLSYQVVEMTGGNPYYLLASIRAHNAEPVLRKIAEVGLLIGWSAGAVVLGPTLDVADQFISHLRENVELEDQACL